jgi:hypothetical protein
MKKIITVLTVTFILSGSGYCGFGESGWMIFRKVQSSRFYLNAAVSPRDGGLFGMLNNPASLRITKGSAFALISELGPAGGGFGGILSGFSMSKISAGGYFAYHNAGDAELNWLEGAQLRTRKVCAQSDVMGAVTVKSDIFDGISAGAALKAAGSTVAEDESAFAVAGDVGILAAAAEGISLSLSLRNLGYSSRFNDESSSLPVSVLAGGGYSMSFRGTDIIFTAGADYHIYEKEFIPAAGVEFRYESLLLDAGYRFGVEEFAFQACMTLQLGNTVFGYSYIPGAYLDAVHRASIGCRIGN